MDVDGTIGKEEVHCSGSCKLG